MSGIITITFSPCIDKSTSVDKIIPEKKLKCTFPKLEPGGGGINVARAIKKLGGNATAIYPSGGYTGKYFDKLMQDEGVSSIVIEVENETRENIIVLEELNNQQYRFGMPGTELKENEWKKILYTISEIKDVQYIIASGSLPPGVPEDVFARISRIAKRKKAKFIADTSGQALKYVMEEGAYLLKPNLGELSSLVNKKYLEPNEIIDSAKQIIKKGTCEVLVVSLGSNGAMLVTKNMEMKYTPPLVERKSTVGAGDSMVAGIVLAISKAKRVEEVIQYGVACGTAATLNQGTELCKLKDVENIFKDIIKEKIISERINHSETKPAA